MDRAFIIFLLQCVCFIVLTSCSKEAKTKTESEWADYVKYDTFDEWTMQGVGDCNSAIFVYVKKINDTISVYKSTDIKFEYRYIKQGNYWYSRTIFDESVITHNLDVKSYKMTDPPYARVYDRFIFNDSIIEYVSKYSGEPKFVKNRLRMSMHKLICLRKSPLDFSCLDIDIYHRKNKKDDNRFSRCEVSYDKIFEYKSPSEMLKLFNELVDNNTNYCQRTNISIDKSMFYYSWLWDNRCKRDTIDRRSFEEFDLIPYYEVLFQDGCTGVNNRSNKLYSKVHQLL